MRYYVHVTIPEPVSRGIYLSAEDRDDAVARALTILIERIAGTAIVVESPHLKGIESRVAPHDWKDRAVKDATDAGHARGAK